MGPARLGGKGAASLLGEQPPPWHDPGPGSALCRAQLPDYLLALSQVQAHLGPCALTGPQNWAGWGCGKSHYKGLGSRACRPLSPQKSKCETAQEGEMEYI